jgi:hypothetical protein
MNMTRRSICVLLPLLALSCAEGTSPVTVDAQWNLTCPADSEVGCGALAPETCLGPIGQRTIAGEFREISCTGDPIIAVCNSVERADGTTFIELEANVGNDFAFELTAIVNRNDDSVGATCDVTIVEDQLPYDVGACGREPPSMDQPCQLTNISTDGAEVSFDLQCASLLSSTSSLGFDVGAVGGGPTTIRFQNCTGSF